MKSEQEGIEKNSGEVLLSMFEKVWSIRGLPNISIKCKSVGSNYYLMSIVKSDACFTKTHTSLIHLILTNKPSSFN